MIFLKWLLNIICNIGRAFGRKLYFIQDYVSHSLGRERAEKITRSGRLGATKVKEEAISQNQVKELAEGTEYTCKLALKFLGENKHAETKEVLEVHLNELKMFFT